MTPLLLPQPPHLSELLPEALWKEPQLESGRPGLRSHSAPLHRATWDQSVGPQASVSSAMKWTQKQPPLPGLLRVENMTIMYLRGNVLSNVIVLVGTFHMPCYPHP